MITLLPRTVTAVIKTQLGLLYTSTSLCPQYESLAKAWILFEFYKCGKTRNVLSLTQTKKSTNQLTFLSIKIRFAHNRFWVFLKTHCEKITTRKKKKKKTGIHLFYCWEWVSFHWGSSWSFMSVLGYHFSWTHRSRQRVFSCKWTWNETDTDCFLTLKMRNRITPKEPLVQSRKKVLPYIQIFKYSILNYLHS